PPDCRQLVASLVNGLFEGIYNGVRGEDAERRMVGPKKRFDSAENIGSVSLRCGVDWLLGLRRLRDADGSKGVQELKDNSNAHRKICTLRGRRQLVPSTHGDAHLLARMAAAAHVRTVEVREPAPSLQRHPAVVAQA